MAQIYEDNEIVKLKYDVVFKMFACNKNNEKSLRSLLSRILDIPVDDIGKIEILNTELLPEEEDEKFGRVDINMEVGDRKIDIEMQFRNEGNFPERTLFYWSKLYSGSLKSGENYNVLPECVCINIINFNLFDCKEYHSQFKVLETQRHELLTNKLNIHFFELTKLADAEDKNDPLWLWMKLINAETKEDLNMLDKTNCKEIQDAVFIIREMSADERAKEVSRRREKRLHDEANAMYYAKNLGIAEGRAEGKAEGRAEGRAEGEAIGEKRGRAEGEAKRQAEIAESMRQHGLTEEQIKAILGDE